jgi:hypothetical protein
MTLEEVVKRLDSLDEEMLICVQTPWSKASDVRLAPSPDGRVPKEVTDAGYKYFLGVMTAREVLEVFGTRTPSLEEKIDCLLYYAENDAYPEWVHS